MACATERIFPADLAVPIAIGIRRIINALVCVYLRHPLPIAIGMHFKTQKCSK
jgi:hypothetical protein